MAAWSNRFLILLGAAGIFIAGFLSYATWQHLEIPCGGQLSCNLVQQSVFANVKGVSVSYIGLLGYVALFAVAVVRAMTTGTVHKRLSVLGFAMAALGMLFSLFLTYASIAILRMTCIWCLASLAVIVLTTILHAALLQGEAPEIPDMKIGLPGAAVVFIAALSAIALRANGLRGEIELGLELVTPDKISLADALPRTEKVIGSDNAKVTVIEFADFNCPACRKSWPKVRETIGKYGDRIRFAYRHFPLMGSPGHELSDEAALFAEYAADRGKFWDYVAEIMKDGNRDRIKEIEGLIAVAVESGLNRSELVKTFNSPDPEYKAAADRYYELLNDDINIGTDIGIAQTPTLVIYAEGHKPVAVSSVRLEAELESEPYRSLLRRP